MSAKLSPTREVFAREFVRIGNGSRAYRVAYKLKPDTKPETVWSAASRLLADVKVAARVRELKEAAAKRAGITVENRIAELETNLALARELEQINAANQAIMGQARIGGLLKDKLELTGKDEGAIRVDSEVTLEERSMNEIARRIAFTLQMGMRAKLSRPKSDEST